MEIEQREILKTKCPPELGYITTNKDRKMKINMKDPREPKTKAKKSPAMPTVAI